MSKLKEFLKRWREKIERDQWRADNNLPPADFDRQDWWILVGCAVIICWLIVVLKS